jgi:hypothetical protein
MPHSDILVLCGPRTVKFGTLWILLRRTETIQSCVVPKQLSSGLWPPPSRLNHNPDTSNDASPPTPPPHILLTTTTPTHHRGPQQWILCTRRGGCPRSSWWWCAHPSCKGVCCRFRLSVPSLTHPPTPALEESAGCSLSPASPHPPPIHAPTLFKRARGPGFCPPAPSTHPHSSRERGVFVCAHPRPLTPTGPIHHPFTPPRSSRERGALVFACRPPSTTHPTPSLFKRAQGLCLGFFFFLF